MKDPNILLDAFKLKPAAAIEYLKRKGYGFSWNWYDMWKDAHAKAFTVAKVTKVEVMRDIRNMVKKAIDDGITLQQFKNELKPQLQKKGWWGKKEHVNKETGEVTEYMAGSPRRLKTIYQTNLQTAYMAGRYKGQMDAAGDLPYLQYIAVTDGKTTDSCRELHGKVFRANDPIWNEFYPPNHWGCRSRVRSLTERQVEKMGIRPESSEGRIVEKEVTVGKGEKARQETVSGLKLSNGKTYWTGAGWNYNPGKEAWMPDLSIYHPADAKAFIQEEFTGPHYKRFFEAEGKIGGVIPIAVLPDDYRGALGTKTNIVRLSAENLWKNHAKHPKFKIADLQQLQLHLEEPKVVAVVSGEHRAQTLVVFNEINGELIKTVFKGLKTQNEVYFLSMHHVSKKHAENVLSKAIKILRGKL